MSEASDRFEGGCLCGAVRFVATGQPKGVAWCHCESCRKHSGAPVSVFVLRTHRIHRYQVRDRQVRVDAGEDRAGLLRPVWINADLRNSRSAYADGFPCRCVR
jgi:hypothetical protein